MNLNNVVDAVFSSRLEMHDGRATFSLISYQNEAKPTFAGNKQYHAQVVRNENKAESGGLVVLKEVQKSTQKQVPENNVRENETALHEFCRFYVCHNKLLKMVKTLEDELEYCFKI